MTSTKSSVLTAIIEATAETDTMATPLAMLSCASQRQHQFVFLVKNTASPPLVTLSH